MRSPGDLNIEVTYSLQLRGEVWAGDINPAMSECSKSVVLKVFRRTTIALVFFRDSDHPRGQAIRRILGIRKLFYSTPVVCC